VGVGPLRGRLERLDLTSGEDAPMAGKWLTAPRVVSVFESFGKVITDGVRACLTFVNLYLIEP
jgi:hypothetical protein